MIQKFPHLGWTITFKAFPHVTKSDNNILRNKSASTNKTKAPGQPSLSKCAWTLVTIILEFELYTLRASTGTSTCAGLKKNWK